MNHRPNIRRAAVTAWSAGPSGYARGLDVKRLVITVGGQPQWSSSQQAWVFAAHRTGDLVALAEHEGRRVIWLGERPVAS